MDVGAAPVAAVRDVGKWWLNGTQYLGNVPETHLANTSVNKPARRREKQEEREEHKMIAKENVKK